MNLIQMRGGRRSGMSMLEITIKVDEEHAEELIQLGKRLVKAVEILEEFVEDVRIVQGVLLTKIVQVAITIGTPEEKFIEKVRLTWKYFERLDKERKEKEREGVIH